MAIQFARVEFVSRSSGGNACRSSAYIAHGRVVFEGTKFQPKNIYNFSDRSEVLFDAIFIPEGVNEKFRDPNILWNAAEQKENRKNSQTAIHEVLALPDDNEVSDEDRQNLVKEYAYKNYVSKGLAVQVAIHKEISENGSYHNIHAHLLGTTRYFNKNGEELGEKARDLMPTVAKGFVVKGDNRSLEWSKDQNLYFEEHGIPIRVDPSGVISQKHLGPVRMRGQGSIGIIKENEFLNELNRIELKDPKKVMDKLLETRNYFTKEDVNDFLSKFVNSNQSDISSMIEDFWKQESIIELLDIKSEEPTGKYTSVNIVEEEKKILRLSEKIYNQKIKDSEFNLNLKKYTEKLNQEQQIAFVNVVKGKGLSLIEGHAGTGKSYLLSALKNYYIDKGFTVRAFGPDSVTTGVLKENGLPNAKTIHKFNFEHKNEKVKFNRGRELWLVDESAKISNRAMSEFLKAAEMNQARIVFCGSSSQLSSVERGGMFQVFCEKYGFEVLKNIQRQKTKTQLKITNNLALGRVGEAIGEIVQYGGAEFKGSKADADRALFKQWVADRKAFPGASTVIIANSYKEINNFNECVRQQLKKEGLISTEDKLCRTFYGDVLISVGDRIEFRQNNPEIGVTNGLKGVVTKLCENEFNVQYQNEKGIQKTINFDPRDFVHYSLPYSKTYSRVQGETYDRAYVSNTSYMSLQRFYVAGTRHRYKMYVFSSAKEAKNVAELKLQASKSEWKGSTLHYTTKDQILKDKEVASQKAYIKDLKESPSILSRFAGKTYEVVDSIGSSIKNFHQAALDRSKDESFYKYDKVDYKGRGGVTEISSQKEKDSEDVTKINIDLINKELQVTPLKATDDLKYNYANQKNTNKSELLKEHKSILTHYFDCVEKANSLGIIVKQEKALSGPILHEYEWKKACGTRNEAAYDVMKFIPNESLKNVISKKGAHILEDRASRHEEFLKTKENTFSIEDQLKQNLEPLLYKLFPDGASSKSAKGLRFGSKGSLSVTLTGKYAGSYKDFEKGDSGGAVQLISKMLGYDREETLKWAKEFLGTVGTIEVPKHFINNFKEKEDNWISMKAESHKVPDIKEIAPSIMKVYAEDARYPYKNEKGEILFFVLRLIKKDRPAEKIVLPLSYGYYQGDEKLRWALKGYKADEKLPIFNLSELKKSPNSTILIVEGEKTATAAHEMFAKENICCVTWSGGAKSVFKSDWTPLMGRNVIIWPDNDKAGMDACEDICYELRKIGVSSLCVVDKKILNRDFPQKWDLADPLPGSMNYQNIKELMFNGQEKAISSESVLIMLNIKENDHLDKFTVNEVLWRTDQRLRTELEEKPNAKEWEIKSKIKNETVSILNNRDKISEELVKRHNVPAELAKRVGFCAMIHQAKTGNLPTEKEVSQLRELMIRFSPEKILSESNVPKEWRGIRTEIISFAIDRTLADLYSFGHQNLSEKHLQQSVTSLAQTISRLAESEKDQKMNQQQKNIQLERSL